MKVKQEKKFPRKLPLKRKTSLRVPRKIAIALVLTLIATVAYFKLRPYTYEYKQNIKLEQSQRELINHKTQLEEQLKSQSGLTDQQKKEIDDLNKKIEEQKKQLEAKKPKGVPKAYAAELPQTGSEDTAWNFFISKGFTKEQTAGILGNLQQEHGFKTSQAAGGLGIAQWIGGRADKLRSKPNHLDFNVQLQYIMEEFASNESRAYDRVKAATSVYEATLAFQDGYERCGDCRFATRLGYAQAIYNRH